MHYVYELNICAIYVVVHWSAKRADHYEVNHLFTYLITCDLMETAKDQLFRNFSALLVVGGFRG